MKIIKTNKSNFILWMITVLVIFLIIFISVKDYIDLKRNARYTVGITIKKYKTPKSGTNFIFRFNVNNFDYESFQDYYPKIKIPNGRYFVKYSSKDPENCKLLIDFEVPDSLTVIPKNGWKENPTLR